MKRLSFFILALAASFTLHAQWVDDPINNNHIANSPGYSGEIFLSTDVENGDTYVQWTSSGSNGYGPTLQRLTFDGTPQWGDDGIRILGHNFASWSQGHAMDVTTDHAVVSCFATANDITVAVKINADGTYAWGEQGVTLFNGHGNSRAEIIAGNDGGAWALGFEENNLYLQYIKANGSLYPCITIEQPGYRCSYGQLTLGPNNTVFLTYEKIQMTSGIYGNKELHLVGYAVDGTQISPDVLLMSTQNFIITYIHYVVPDGLGGAYAYIWHPGIGDAFNTYVFHYDANGASTISDTNGIPVHSIDPAHFYVSARGTVDPVTHDLIIAYIQTDSWSQATRLIYMNRITPTGERVWGEGILVYDNGTNGCGGLSIDTFEDGSGFALVYYKGGPADDGRATIEAVGLDMDGNVLWNKQLCSANYPKSSAKRSTGFHMGQNIVAWVNSDEGGIYGQNFDPNGNMGPIEPPVITCLAPENLEGNYIYDTEAQTFGALLTWTAPETQPLHYHLIRTDLSIFMTTELEVQGDAVSYFDEVNMGNYMYQLTAVYENCESDYALSVDGEYQIFIEVTGIEENIDDEIVTLVRIINVNGQTLLYKDVNELASGFYILQGTNKAGQMVNKKIFVNK